MGRRATILLAAFVGLVAAAAGGASAEPARTVAVLPLVVHAMEDQDYLRAGLADMLASRLGRWGELGVIRVDDLSVATTDAEAARAAGRGVGADWVIFGSFTRFGDGASLDVRCVDVRSTGEGGARSIFVQAGRLGEIIPKLDELAEKVARYVASDGTARPDVAAAGPAEPAGAAALRAELAELRERVEKLESELSGEPAAAGAEPGGSQADGADPAADLAHELR